MTTRYLGLVVLWRQPQTTRQLAQTKEVRVQSAQINSPTLLWQGFVCMSVAAHALNRACLESTFSNLQNLPNLPNLRNLPNLPTSLEPLSNLSCTSFTPFLSLSRTPNLSWAFPKPLSNSFEPFSSLPWTSPASTTSPDPLCYVNMSYASSCKGKQQMLVVSSGYESMKHSGRAIRSAISCFCFLPALVWRVICL